MRRKIHSLALIAVAVCAIAPAAATADPWWGDGPGKTCATDYSRNPVNGTYCVRSTQSPVSAVAHPSAAPATVVVKHDGFSWGDAAAGAGAALVLGLVAGGVIGAMRRRHGSTTVASRSPATG
jgi:hypothetical protein